jgi:hypothetical protein
LIIWKHSSPDGTGTVTLNSWSSAINSWSSSAPRGDYVDHYNRERPHRGLDLYMPMATDEVMGAGPVVRRARLGGLINEYSRLAA